MGRRRLPRAASAAVENFALAQGEVVQDTTLGRPRFGDGVTPGGHPVMLASDLSPAHAPWSFVATEGQTAFNAVGSAALDIAVFAWGHIELVAGEDYSRVGDVVTMALARAAGDQIDIAPSSIIPNFAQRADKVGAADRNGAPSTVQAELAARAYDDLSNVVGVNRVGVEVISGSPQVEHVRDFRWVLGAPAAHDDIAQHSHFRFANYNGGNGGSPQNGGGGWTNSIHRYYNYIGEGARANEWATISGIFSKAPGFGSPIPENCAHYSIAYRQARSDSQPTGPVNGSVSEAVDETFNPVYGLCAHEFDVSVVGPNNLDPNNARCGTLLAIRPQGVSTGNEVAKGHYIAVFAGVHLKDMFVYQSFGGTVGNYFNMPNFLLTAAGDGQVQSMTAARSSAQGVTTARLAVKIDGTEFGRAYCDAAGAFVLAANGAGAVRLNPTVAALEPLTHNAVNLGSASLHYKDAFLVNAPTVSSDARLKTALRPYSDAELDAIGAVPIGVYQLLASVAEKGDDARLHSGVIAQAVQAAFAAQGLDAGRYGFWCADPVTETVDLPVPVERPVMEPFTDYREAVTIVDGKAVRSLEPFAALRPVHDDYPMVDADGVPVMIPASAAQYAMRPKEGAPPGSRNPQDYERVMVRPAMPERPRLHSVPRMETVELVQPVTRVKLDVDGTPLVSLSIRYEELAMARLAWLERELARVREASA